MAVVGGGIVGLASARELALGGLSVCLLERESELASHQSARNSGVVHAGIYYRPGSLKARLCVEGAAKTRAYARSNGLPMRESGKLIVATEEREVAALEALAARGAANGVERLRMLDAREIETIEPACLGVAALHSPMSAVSDFRLLARAYANDLSRAGGEIAAACEVRGARQRPGGVVIEHDRGELSARYALFCAGAWSDRLARAGGSDEDPRIVPFRGQYLRLRDGAAQLVSSMIYPVPDPGLPFLGVHLTRTIGDEVLLGPTALPSLSRSARRRASLRDALDAASWAGSWRMAARQRGAAAGELRFVLSRSLFARAAARYVPQIKPDDLEHAYSGVRAQALGRDGTLIDDFSFSHSPRVLHVRNAPSPAATAAPAIAALLAERVRSALAGGHEPAR